MSFVEDMLEVDGLQPFVQDEFSAARKRHRLFDRWIARRQANATVVDRPTGNHLERTVVSPHAQAMTSMVPRAPTLESLNPAVEVTKIVTNSAPRSALQPGPSME